MIPIGIADISIGWKGIKVMKAKGKVNLERR